MVKILLTIIKIGDMIYLCQGNREPFTVLHKIKNVFLYA